MLSILKFKFKEILEFQDFEEKTAIIRGKTWENFFLSKNHQMFCLGFMSMLGLTLTPPSGSVEQ